VQDTQTPEQFLAALPPRLSPRLVTSRVVHGAVGPPSILVTGCSSGIGLDAALRLSALGWRVFATCRNEPPAVLGACGVRVIDLELESPASVVAAAATLRALQDGPLDAVFLNAGYAVAGAVEDLPLKAWQTQFQVNLFSQVDLANRLIRSGLLSQGSRLVWCGSVLGIVPMPMRGAYAASKAAMEAVADAQRLELAHKGISVSVIQPGPILTRFRANSLVALLRWVDLESTDYLPAYAATVARLRKVGAASPGTLGPEAVTEALLRCLDASRPHDGHGAATEGAAAAVARCGGAARGGAGAAAGGHRCGGSQAAATVLYRARKRLMATTMKTGPAFRRSAGPR